MLSPSIKTEEPAMIQVLKTLGCLMFGCRPSSLSALDRWSDQAAVAHAEEHIGFQP